MPTLNNPPMPATLPLTNTFMAKLKPAKVFKAAVEAPPPSTSAATGTRSSGPRHITAISFDDRGDQVITAAEDETFRLYKCSTGKHIKTLHSKKYGVDLPRFTHKNTNILHASTKEDDTVRYHSLHDNKYLQYFKGHKGRVVSLEVAYADDGFMSGSLDGTVRLWDLRTPNCRGLLNVPSAPITAYDSTSSVFAIGVSEYSRILLYDQANFDKEPFLNIILDDPLLSLITYPPRAIYMSSIAFSSNGKYILVGCSGDTHYIMDAFEGHLLARLEGHLGLERRKADSQLSITPVRGCSGEEVSWTPDSKYVVGGGLDGKVHVWDVQNLATPQNAMVPPMQPQRIKPLSSMDGHPGPSRCVRFNPRYAMMVSAGTELAFWLPDLAGDADDTKDLLKKRVTPGG